MTCMQSSPFSVAPWARSASGPFWHCQPAASWVSEAGNPPEVVQKCKTICTKKATLSFFFTSSSHFTSSMISLALVSSNCNFYTSFDLGTEVPYVLVLLLLRDV